MEFDKEKKETGIFTSIVNSLKIIANSEPGIPQPLLELDKPQSLTLGERFRDRLFGWLHRS